MTEAIRNRIGPASGVLFFVLLMGGAAIHGYPEIAPSDSQLAGWLATLDPGRFNAGMYIEALGVLLFMPFATWLYRRLRQGPRDASYAAITMLAASAGWVVFTLDVLGGWAGLADQAGKGLDVRVAQTVVAINQASYDFTNIVLGLTVLAAGVAIVRGGAMSRFAGWAAIGIGVLYVVTLPIGRDATPAGILGYLWIFAIASYYTFRPGREREVTAAADHRSAPTGLQASR
jgi:hypothetical protein